MKHYLSRGWAAAVLICLSSVVFGAGNFSTSTTPCPTFNKVTVDGITGDIVVDCKTTTATPTTPTPPVVVVTPVTPSTGCKAVAVIPLVWETISKDGRLVDQGKGDIYSGVLPRTGHGFATTRDPDTPPSLNTQAWISKCPGDMSYTKAPEATFRYSFMPTVPYYPCVAEGSAESLSMYWGPVVGQNTCPVTVDQQVWYMNFRVAYPSGVTSCPEASRVANGGPGCPIRFRWF